MSNSLGDGEIRHISHYMYACVPHSLTVLTVTMFQDVSTVTVYRGVMSYSHTTVTERVQDNTAVNTAILSTPVSKVRMLT
jgi:ribosome-binding factor A